ncbi:MAG: hypothetical protein N2510_02310 [Ignavibacteria bacterium]|nr:hypothetical protein [Ignavibacteria bacterium]
MNKLIISSIVTGAFLFLSGWLLWGVLLGDFFSKHYGHIQRGADMKLWALAVANLAQGVLIYLLYSSMYKGGSAFSNGIKHGILIALFWSLPYVFMTWAEMTVTYTAVILDGALSFIVMLVATVITAFIHGEKAQPS